MSTRAQIKVKNSELFIYKHSDGYPSEVIPVLEKIVTKFTKNRGDDAFYLVAQIIRAFAVYEHNEYKEDIKNQDDNFAYGLDCLGWGVGLEEHGDIDYLYEVDGKGNIYINGEKLTKKRLDLIQD